jgi:integrase
VLHRLERNLFPTLGEKPIADIDAPMLLDTVRTVESRGAHDLAHRMIGVAGQVFRYAVVCKLCKGDPSRDLRGALTKHTPRHQHAIKQDQLPALLNAIDGYPAVGEKQTALALRLSFVRTAELIEATGLTLSSGNLRTRTRQDTRSLQPRAVPSRASRDDAAMGGHARPTCQG